MRRDRHGTAGLFLGSRVLMLNRALMLGLAIVVATTAAAPKPSPTPAPGGNLTTKNMTIVTDTTDSNWKTGDFTMPHHVKFTRPGTAVVGDSARGNTHNEAVTITGHVVMNDDGNAPEGRAAGAASGGGPSTMTCDQLAIDAKNKVYIATGNVHYTQGQRHASAQYGKLDQNGHTLELRGNVHLADNDSTFSGDYIHYDTLTKDVHTEGAPETLTLPMSGLPARPAPAPTKKP